MLKTIPDGLLGKAKRELPKTMEEASQYDVYRCNGITDRVYFHSGCYGLFCVWLHDGDLFKALGGARSYRPTAYVGRFKGVIVEVDDE